MAKGTGERDRNGLAGHTSVLPESVVRGSLLLGASLVLWGCAPSSSNDKAPNLTSSLDVTPAEDFLLAGPEGGPFFPASKAYLLTNRGDAPMHWSASSNHSSVSFSSLEGILDPGESKIVTALADEAPGLPPGRHVVDLTFANQSTGGEEVEVDAVLSVAQAAVLEVSPATGFSSSGTQGGAFQPLAAPYVLTNSNAIALDWAITIDQPFVSASLSSGQLQPQASEGITLSVDASQAALLAPGSHPVSVTLNDLTHATEHEIIVLLEVAAPAALTIVPADGFSSGGSPGGPFSPATKTYTLSNTGTDPLAWTSNGNSAWVTLSSSSGILASGQQVDVQVGFDLDLASSLPPGTNHDQVIFVNETNGVGDSSRPVDFTLNVAPGTLTVGPPQGFASSGTEGGSFSPASTTYTLTNDGDMTLTWQSVATVPWLTLSLTGGNLAPGNSTQVIASVQQTVAAAMAAGQYSGQIAFSNLTNGSGDTSLATNLNVIPSGGGSAPILPVGLGFSGPTQEPGKIGSGTAKCIANWDVVPFQTIVAATTPTFTVGVVAFHIAGIEKVRFILQDGLPVDVTSMSLNPRTGVWEYCATIDASLFSSDGPIELRAIAYPNAAAPQAEGTGAYPGGGDPRLLDSLFLYMDADLPAPALAMYCSPGGSDANGDGSQGNPFASPWKAAKAVHDAGGGSADGGTVFMGAGDYDWSQVGGGSVPVTQNAWLTFQPWPGLTRADVRIVSGRYPGLSINLLRMHNVTMTQYLHGDDGDAGGPGGDDIVWLDHVTCVGAGQGTSTHFGGWLPGFQRKYWTDCQISDDQGSIGTVILARNVHSERIGQGTGKSKLVVNCTWDSMGNGGNSAYHPDWIAWNFTSSTENNILYGLRATNATGAQAFFVKQIPSLENVAIVNSFFQAGASPIGASVDNLSHFLMWNCTGVSGTVRWDMPQSKMKNISFRGNVIHKMSIGNGDSVDGSWFDQNHFTDIHGYGHMSAGTNLTEGDPMLFPNYVPQPTSPLRDRLNTLLVPMDLTGVLHQVPGTVGAFQ